MPVQTLEKPVKTAFETVDSRLETLQRRIHIFRIFRRFGHPRILSAGPI